MHTSLCISNCCKARKLGAMTMKAVIVSYGLFKDFGGPTKTVASFQAALGAEILSFMSKAELAERGLGIPGTHALLASRIPVLHQLRWPGNRASKEARHLLRDADLVSSHLHYRGHVLWVNRECRRTNTPYWVVPHGVLDPFVMESRPIIKRLFNQIGGYRYLREAAGAVFATHREREKALSQFEIGGRHFVIPWPVDPVVYVDQVKTRSEIRAALGIPEDARVLVYFGRVHSMKRPLETIAAFGRVARDRPESHLLMVGGFDGVSRDECLRQASNYGIAERFHPTGAVYGPDRFAYLAASDAYISLSRRENFNHTAAESMSSGLPIILSPGNDLSEELRSSGVGWFLPDDSLKAAAAAIDAFLNSGQDELLEMGRSGSQWVAENLSFASFRKKLLEASAHFLGVGEPQTVSTHVHEQLNR